MKNDSKLTLLNNKDKHIYDGLNFLHLMNDIENFDDLNNICFMVYAIETSLVYSIKKDTYDLYTK